MQKAHCRYAPSLGELEGRPELCWGTPDYNFIKNRRDPTVFFGLYDLRDYIALRMHRGKAWVLWAGSDIKNLSNGFLMNDGKLMLLSKIGRGRFKRLVVDTLSRAEHWVENDVEREALEKCGLFISGVRPSFMGNINQFHPIKYPKDKKTHVFLSSSEGRQEEYGFGTVERIANRLPNHLFHLYGAKWDTKRKNVIVHGRVPKCVMNNEINGFHVGLRDNKFDGFSEITAKAILTNKHVVSRIKYPGCRNYKNDSELVNGLDRIAKMGVPPDKLIRKYYLNLINDYPWRT